MSGSANLKTGNLIDGLVPMIDRLRGSLNPAFGVRPFRVFTVLRAWSGQITGEGSYVDVETELTPQPRVWFWNGFKWVLTPAGVNEDGDVKLTEVSLSYTYDELVLRDPDENQQWFYKLVDAYGQGSPPRLLRVKAPPFPDREKDIGWTLTLVNMNLPEGT